MIVRALALLVLLLLATAAYVRLAPFNATRWHVMPAAAAPGDYREMGAFRAVRRIVAPGPEVLAALGQRALATPRTRLVAGSLGEGMLTFETRSLVFGFPDYTTVALRDDLLDIYGRLRFGGSDQGVNRARIKGWLETLGPLTETP